MTDFERAAKLADTLRRVERHIVARAAAMARFRENPNLEVVAALEVVAEAVTPLVTVVRSSHSCASPYNQ